MGRERGSNPFTRISETKEPKQVFLLACEGRHTERKYFLGIQENKAKLQILEYIEIEIFEKSNPDMSNPLKIFEELIAKIENKGIEADEVCLIVDRDSDSFKEEQYIKVVNGCRENKFHLYLSNPNFELWLLFHFIDELSSEEEDRFLSQKGEVAKELQRYLKINELSRAKTFNKKILFEHYIDRIDNAIRVAKKYEDDIEKLKDKLGTNVYQLVEKLII
ncbi:RloB family protein [Fusobacterium sp. HC1336]|uniref:RloB family protein n=1 Tax=Fusobacterium sp. HC1336 TaxID=3171169 RepID=UPI003F2400BD